ncbi:MAG: hypothetical protein QXJ64_02950 [Thermosphaera sp.]
MCVVITGVVGVTVSATGVVGVVNWIGVVRTGVGVVRGVVAGV